MKPLGVALVSLLQGLFIQQVIKAMASQQPSSNGNHVEERPDQANTENNPAEQAEIERLSTENSHIENQLRVLRTFLSRLVELPEAEARQLLARLRDNPPNARQHSGQREESGSGGSEALLRVVSRLNDQSDPRNPRPRR